MTFAILVWTVTHTLVILLGTFFLTCLAAVIVAMLRHAPARRMRAFRLINGHVQTFLHPHILPELAIRDCYSQYLCLREAEEIRDVFRRC